MWPFNRKRKIDPPTASSRVPLPPQTPDNPRGFGFKNTWWALPSEDTEAVVDAICLHEPQPANWQTGVDHAYENDVFVTPPVDGWTLITGFRLPPNGQRPRDEVIEPLVHLSELFGTTLVFSTHRVVEYHVWAKAENGTLIRAYGYVGESGRTFWDEGPLTVEEEGLGFRFFDERCPEAQNDSYWEREDLQYPDEMSVMDIAREWSVSPYDFEGLTTVQPSLGVLGTRSEVLKRVEQAT